MKLFKFNKKELKYEDVTNKFLFSFILTSLISSISLFILFIYNLNNVKYISQETRTIILNQEVRFSDEKLREYILELNIKYPHIVYAQARLESGNFTSKIFKENNNLFGMKMAVKRPTTNKGEQFGHAYYENWRDSVVDYAMFSARFLHNIKNENDYFEYLKQNYAEDPNYISNLKKIIERENNSILSVNNK
jgi:uncharacterized FlgJ-related protein